MKTQYSFSRGSIVALAIAICFASSSCTDDGDAPTLPADGGAPGAGASAGGATDVEDGGTGGFADPGPVRARVTGSAQKGPIVAGSSVSVFGLDTALEPTGTIFPSQTKDSLGSFDVSANLSEAFVEVVVQGPYYDELNGQLSASSIVLRGLAAAEPNTDLRVNLLTTISKNRIRHLVDEGEAFDEAVARAEDEVLSAFGIEDDTLEAFAAMDITGSSPSDAALIALSAILLQYADDHSSSESEKVSQLAVAVSSLASDLEDGVLNDSGLALGIPTAAARLDVDAVTEHLKQIYEDLGKPLIVPDIAPFVATVGSPAPWQFAPSLPTNLSGHCACAVGNKIYVMGGADGEGLDVMFEYDPPTKQWKLKAKMLLARAYPACSVVNDVIYVTGGLASGDYSATVEAYDPAEDAWTSKNPMPLGRASHASITLDGKIYVMGGLWSQPMDSVVVYDPAQDAWEAVAPLPTPLMFLASAELSGRLYVLGGGDGSGNGGGASPVAYEYDPLADAWTPRAPLPTARSGASAVALGGKIYVMGGHDGTKPVGIVEEYDPPTDTWTTKTPMNVARNYVTASISGDLAYVIGGGILVDNSAPTVTTVETYDPLKDVWSH